MIDRVLGDVRQRFLEDAWLRQPFARAGGAAFLTELGSWNVVESLFAPSSDAPSCDALIVRAGSRWESSETPMFAEARRLFDEGYTVLVRHAERQHAGLAELAESFRAAILAPVDVHVYCTPASQFGFGWHYDAEDVFIVQTVGAKEYFLRKNTVNPWPLVETLPADMRYERELMPVMQCRLEAGDWLYIPHGWWHRAEAREDSISLAVGVLPASGIDVLDAVRRELLDSLRWRQRMPAAGVVTGAAREELLAQWRERLAELADDLAATVKSEAFAETILAAMEERSHG